MGFDASINTYANISARSIKKTTFGRGPFRVMIVGLQLYLYVVATPLVYFVLSLKEYIVAVGDCHLALEG